MEESPARAPGAAAFVRFLRPVTLAAPVAGVVGGAVAANGGFPQDATPLVFAVASALLLTGASNGLNQIADVETDRINRPDRPLPSGQIGLRTAWVWTGLLTAGAVAAATMVNVAFVLCGVVTLPLTAAYSLPPFRLKRVPLLANAVIATPRGLLLVVAGWAAGGGAERTDAWVIGAVAWLYVLGASVTKDFGDVEGDRATAVRSLPILWGPKAAAAFVAPFLVAPFALLWVLAGTGVLPGGWSGWGFLCGPLAAVGVVAAVLLLRRPGAPGDAGPHPAWGLMYFQLTALHLGTAWVYAGL